MKRALGLFGLTMMSTAAIIGAGIFALTGQVAKKTAGKSRGGAGDGDYADVSEAVRWHMT